MGTRTYLEMVNITLRDINEVPLTAANFTVARGLQDFTKEAVNRALLDIINFSDEWPWLVNVSLDATASPKTNSITTVDKQIQYPVVATDTIDWDTFVSTDANGNRERLKYISYPGYLDLSERNDRAGKPSHVYRSIDSQDAGFWPTPGTEIVTITFISWKDPVLLSLSTDTIPFPDRWYPTLISRARYYVWMFRENVEQAQVANSEYDANVKRMFKALMLPTSNLMRAI